MGSAHTGEMQSHRSDRTRSARPPGSAEHRSQRDGVPDRSTRSPFRAWFDWPVWSIALIGCSWIRSVRPVSMRSAFSEAQTPASCCHRPFGPGLHRAGEAKGAIAQRGSISALATTPGHPPTPDMIADILARGVVANERGRLPDESREARGTATAPARLGVTALKRNDPWCHRRRCRPRSPMRRSNRELLGDGPDFLARDWIPRHELATA